jgi:hypothetical protein
VRGKTTSDISTTPGVAPVPLGLSMAVSGLTQNTSSGDIRYEPLQGVGNQFGRSLRPCSNVLTNRARVGT